MRLSENMWYVVLVIALILGLTPFAGFLFSMFGDIADADNRTDDYIKDSGNSARLIYAVEALFFVWLLRKARQIMPQNNKTMVYSNMTYLFCAVLLLFIRFGQGGRITWPFLIGPICIMTYIVDKTKVTNNMKKVILVVSLLLFLRITYEWSFNLSPYKTFFTNGYPCGKRYIYERYEYDRNYTEDKLYRKPIDVVW